MFDRFDRRLVRRQWQEGQHLAQIAPKFFADVFDRAVDVSGHERIAEGLRVLANILVVHLTSRSRWGSSA